ncbi:hypothetical protein AN958_05897 [Leucoagaricus sp. SymC.cos]|nr:hypothetical protein AN958_05897 [Leucoagaricus sp. SymC.cos]
MEEAAMYPFPLRAPPSLTQSMSEFLTDRGSAGKHTSRSRSQDMTNTTASTRRWHE